MHRYLRGWSYRLHAALNDFISHIRPRRDAVPSPQHQHAAVTCMTRESGHGTWMDPIRVRYHEMVRDIGPAQHARHSESADPARVPESRSNASSSSTRFEVRESSAGCCDSPKSHVAMIHLILSA